MGQTQVHLYMLGLLKLIESGKIKSAFIIPFHPPLTWATCRR